ncbi:hypothetical protein [Photobacterium lipolyticum]|uniref:Uncharacterized protein n=1 Tax=Photobacterium lipolyticum TaxID=266810 RepID=A0A2T3MWG8_9GAMM|nr:hypothetical protein [Photobacterium lipolyticum]PSW04296.1 hypothetical protein C9I89_13270 [Photobacterium lipolyticum]
MRKKIMAVFYTLASVLTLTHIGTRLVTMNNAQLSDQPLYVISQESDTATGEQENQQAVDYLMWAQKYNKQVE